MSDTWVISDTHFNHSNILSFTDSTGNPVRSQFSNVKEMDEHMIEKWNETVKPGDLIYHLGDVVMGNKSQDWMHQNFNKLNGRKELIVGNHDDISMLSRGPWFAKIHFWKRLREHDILLTHVPLHPQEVMCGDPAKPHLLFNVHGHIHHNPSPEGRYFNASVENINYTPIHIEEMSKLAKTALTLMCE